MAVYVASYCLQCSVPCLVCSVLSGQEECLLLMVLSCSGCGPELVQTGPEKYKGCVSRELALGAMLQLARGEKLPCYALPTRDLGQTVSSAAAHCLLEETN
jgi:hypothetical protein